LKSQLAKQHLSIFTKQKTRGKAAEIGSYRVWHVIGKYKKPFQDGEMVEEAFIKTGDSLFENFKNNEIVSAIIDF